MKQTSKLKKHQDIVEQVHSLAWSGKHQQAIALASQALEQADLPIFLRMDILSLRVESYIALSKLELAFSDAVQMDTLVKQSNLPEVEKQKLTIQALYHIVLVQIRTGDLQPALDAVTKAQELAYQTNNKEIIAKNLLLLCETQMRTDNLQTAVETGLKAIAMFEQFGWHSENGRAHWLLGVIFARMGQEEESRKHVDAGLILCRQADDQYGIGNLLNTLHFTTQDIVKDINVLHQATQAFKLAGYIERENMVRSNFGGIYGRLGLYTHSRRLRQETADFERAVGAKQGMVYTLLELCENEIELGVLDKAKKYIQEIEPLIPEIGDPYLTNSLVELKGLHAYANGEFSKALRYFKTVLKTSTQKVRHQLKIAQTYLALQKPIEALKITKRLTKENSNYTGNVFEIPAHDFWWWHIQALRANHKEAEVYPALDQAYDLILNVIKSVRDVGLRRNYLNKIKVNQELIFYWVEQGKKRNLPKDRLYSYLDIESNTREPFARLTNTSQRLNTLKNISEIQTFLVEEATELSGAKRVLLILEDGKKLEVVEAIVPKGEAADAILANIKKHLTSARLTRTVQLILPKKQGLSRIIAPLIAQNQVIGYLYADMDSIYGLFDDTDRDMLGMLANQAAVALDNVGLVVGLEQKVNERTQQLQESVYETEQLLKESITLTEVGRDISSSLDTTIVLENIALYAKELMAGDLSAIFLPEENGKVFRSIVAVGEDADELRNDTIQFGSGILGSVAKKKVAEIVNQAEADPRVLAITGTTLGEYENLLGVPMLAGGELKGLMAVWRRGVDKQFVANDLHLLNNLSQQAVIALKNSQLFAEAKKARAEAELASKTKSAFLANMSHELRTPLNAVINFTQLVAMGALGEVTKEQEETLGYSLSSSKHLLQLINDVLDISKIQAGKLNMFIEEDVNLTIEIGEVLSMVESLMKNKVGVQFIKEIDDNLPIVACDRRRLKQILLNLLTNAVKFTQAGTITLHVKHNDNQINFAVMDTGSGIPKEMQGQIFDPFVQTVDGTKLEGTGLGLPITKSLVEAHGGKLWLESEVGEGSAFFFTLLCK